MNQVTVNAMRCRMQYGAAVKYITRYGGGLSGAVN